MCQAPAITTSVRQRSLPSVGDSNLAARDFPFLQVNNAFLSFVRYSKQPPLPRMCFLALHPAERNQFKGEAWIDVRIPDKKRYFPLLQNVHIASGAHPISYSKNTEFYIHGSVHRESNLITVQQDATYSVYYISAGSSTCFGCWHPSSGARTTVITASGI